MWSCSLSNCFKHFWSLFLRYLKLVCKYYITIHQNKLHKQFIYFFLWNCVLIGTDPAWMRNIQLFSTTCYCRKSNYRWKFLLFKEFQNQFSNRLASSTNRIKMKRLVVKCWTEFSANSSINALRYPFNRRLPRLEQCWWRSSFLFFIGAYCFVIGTIYYKWSMNPVMITYTQSMFPLWEVPFPAVTICPTTKVRVEDLNLTDMLIRVQRKETIGSDEYDEAGCS